MYAYQAYSLDVVSFFFKLLLDGFEDILGKIFGPVIVEIGKCVVGSPGANSAGFDRFKDALNCIAKNLTISNMKKHYGKVWELADEAVRKLLGKILPKTVKKLATGPWADVSISLYDAINDRLNPGSQTIHITTQTQTPQRIVYTVLDDNLDWEVWVMNADGTNQQQLTTNDYVSGPPVWSPDGTRIAYTVYDDNRGSAVWVMNADGTNQQQLTTGFGPVWSPDGTRIAYTVYDDNFDWEVWVMNADGTNQQQLTTNDYGYGVGPPAWSPDGTRIAYTAGDWRTGTIWVMNADGTNQQQLTTNYGFGPVWSPDGTRIAYTVYGDNWEVWVMNADGTNQQQLTTNDYGLSHPVWSPDGTRIAYTVYDDNRGSAVWVMNADGTNQQQLTTNYGWCPVWSPDGTRIAYTADDWPNWTVWVMNADGTNQQQLTTNGGCPVWSPLVV